MPHIGQESLMLLERDNERPDRGLVRLGDPLALAADQVHVLGVLGQVVGRRAVVEVAVLNQAEIF
jgi:hypothetical protein